MANENAPIEIKRHPFSEAAQTAADLLHEFKDIIGRHPGAKDGEDRPAEVQSKLGVLTAVMNEVDDLCRTHGVDKDDRRKLEEYCRLLQSACVTSQDINKLIVFLADLTRDVCTLDLDDPQSHPPKGPRSTPLRSWTQAKLDKAIHKYKAKRASVYSDLVEAVAAEKVGAVDAARSIFGRNVIAEALRCRSSSMVSKSRVWRAIAADLRLGETIARIREQVGEGVAGDEAAVARGDIAYDTVIRHETIELINAKLPPKEAAATIKSVEDGDMSDDAARQMVDLCEEQNHDRKREEQYRDRKAKKSRPQ